MADQRREDQSTLPRGENPAPFTSSCEVADAKVRGETHPEVGQEVGEVRTKMTWREYTSKAHGGEDEVMDDVGWTTWGVSLTVTEEGANRALQSVGIDGRHFL